MMELSLDLAPSLAPLAWLVGSWAGAGVGGYPTVEEFHFGQELIVSHDTRPFLTHTSTSWLLDNDGNKLRPLASESGFWRPDEHDDVELVLAHSSGIVEVWVGSVTGARVELRTDLVARTKTAKDYTAAHRLYGLVNGDLLWAHDMAAMGLGLQSHVSARLRRAGK
jgi:hypothetical protein